MSDYTPAELTARLEQISTDPAWAPFWRSLARHAAAGTPGYAINPDDLSDRAIHCALVDGMNARIHLPGVPDDLDRLRALLHPDR